MLFFLFFFKWRGYILYNKSQKLTCNHFKLLKKIFRGTSCCILTNLECNFPLFVILKGIHGIFSMLSRISLGLQVKVNDTFRYSIFLWGWDDGKVLGCGGYRGGGCAGSRSALRTCILCWFIAGCLKMKGSLKRRFFTYYSVDMIDLSLRYPKFLSHKIA